VDGEAYLDWPHKIAQISDYGCGRADSGCPSCGIKWTGRTGIGGGYCCPKTLPGDEGATCVETFR